MKWILIYSFVVFFFLRSKADPPYKKFYPETNSIPWAFESAFLNYLENIKEEVKIRANPLLMSLREPFDRYYHPDNPVNWRATLVTWRDRFWRGVGDVSFVLFAFVLIDAIRGAYINRPWGHIPPLDIFFLISVLPPLFWLQKQYRTDGLTQGYLDGYMDGYDKGYLDAKVEDGRILEPEE